MIINLPDIQRHRESTATKAQADYRHLVRAVAADEAVDAAQANAVILAAGKTLDDLSAHARDAKYRIAWRKQLAEHRDPATRAPYPPQPPV